MWAVLGLVLKYVAAAATAYQGYQSYETGKASAKQAEVNAEAGAEQAARDIEQERLNRQAGQKAEAKHARRRRAAIEAAYAKSGVLIEGTPGEFLQEQAGVDELNIQQRTKASEARVLGLGVRAKNIGIQGRATASGLRARGRGDLLGGVASGAAGAGRATYQYWLTEGQ